MAFFDLPARVQAGFKQVGDGYLDLHKEFQQFEEENPRHHSWPIKAIDETIAKQGPDPASKRTWDIWKERGCFRRLEPGAIRITEEDFRIFVKDNHVVEDHGAELYTVLEFHCPPPVVLGDAELDGDRYSFRLITTGEYLSAHIDNYPGMEKIDYEDLFDLNILCIRPAIKRPDKPMPSAEPTRHLGKRQPPESNVTDPDFVFNQLGTLEYFDAKSETWQPTEFGVVARLDDEGRCGKIYVLYDYHKIRNEEDSGWLEIDPQDRVPKDLFDSLGNLNENVRRLISGHSAQFSRALIAENFDELHKDATFTFKAQSMEQEEVVRARIIGTGSERRLVGIP